MIGKPLYTQNYAHSILGCLWGFFFAEGVGFVVLGFFRFKLVFLKNLQLIVPNRFLQSHLWILLCSLPQTEVLQMSTKLKQVLDAEIYHKINRDNQSITSM